MHQAQSIVHDFAVQLPSIRNHLDPDVIATYQGDPATPRVDEVLLYSPSVLVITYHRFAHEFYQGDLKLLARLIAEITHAKTGMGIHPHAQIDQGVLIDHGTVGVISETCVIGKNV